MRVVDFALSQISLVMLMFCAAALMGYLAVARIAGRRWIALAAP